MATLRDKTEQLRNEALLTLWSSREMADLAALDEAVIALGGSGIALASPKECRAMALLIADSGPAVEAAAATRVARAERRLSQGEAAAAALRAAGEPLPVGRFMEATVAQGALVGGADPLANFRSTVSKDARFVSVMRNGMYFWWFADQPLPAGWAAGAELDLGEESAPTVGTSEEGGDSNAATTTH